MSLDESGSFIVTPEAPHQKLFCVGAEVQAVFRSCAAVIFVRLAQLLHGNLRSPHNAHALIASPLFYPRIIRALADPQ